MTDLEDRLRKVESSRKWAGDDDITTCWHRNPDGPEAADRLRTYREALERIRDRAIKMRKGTDDWFELVEFEADASEALKG